MTKDEKFQIGMVLHYIATSLSDEDFKEVKGFLKDIEKMIAEQTEPIADTPQTDCGWK